jgi:hypothetical protein
MDFLTTPSKKAVKIFFLHGFKIKKAAGLGLPAALCFSCFSYYRTGRPLA